MTKLHNNSCRFFSYCIGNNKRVQCIEVPRPSLWSACRLKTRDQTICWILMKFGMAIPYTSLPSSPKFRENLLSDRLTLLEGVKVFL